MYRFALRAGLLATLLATSGPGARADLLWDNGTPNGASGNEMTHWIQAENFTLGLDSLLTDVRFWAVETDDDSFLGSIWWGIYGDSAGLPSTLLHSGETAISRVATGNSLFFGEEYVNDFGLGAIALPAGSYWLGLHNGPLSETARLDYYWETTDVSRPPTGVEDIEPFGTGSWDGNAGEHAFLLFGRTTAVVPEPGTLALLGVGLVGVVRRRRR